MSKYLEINNDNEQIVVDDETMRIHLENVARLSDFTQYNATNVATYWTYRGGVDSSRAMGWVYLYHIPVTADTMLVAIKPTGAAAADNIGFVVDRVSPTRVNIGMYVRYNTSAVADAIAYNVYVYLFGKSPLSSPNQGLEAYSASGVRVFGSNACFLSVAGQYRRAQSVPVNYPEASYPFSYDTGYSKDFAIAMNSYEAHVTNSNRNTGGVWNAMYPVTIANSKYRETIFSASSYVTSLILQNVYSVMLSAGTRRYADFLFVDVSHIPLPS